MKDIKNKATLKSFWFPLFGFAVALICFYKALDKLPSLFSAVVSFLGILTPLIIGIIIAFILYKPAIKLEELLKKSKNQFWGKYSRGISVFISYAVLLIVIAALLYFIIPRIVISIVNLVKEFPEYYNSVMEYITRLAGEDGRIFGFDISGLKEAFSIENIFSYFNFDRITKYAESVFKAAGSVVDFFVAFVISIYILLGREHLFSVCGKLLRLVIPGRHVDTTRTFILRSCNIFYSYIYSQVLDAAIVAVLCTIVFYIARIPYAFLLAILMGLCNVIPYFGAFIGGFCAVFTTLISTGSIIRAVIILVCILGIQQVDANIIQPRIVAGSVGLRPIYVLLAIMVGGGLFGFFGILFAVPIVAILRMLIVDYMNYKEKSS